jgi:hypothetical protein
VNVNAWEVAKAVATDLSGHTFTPAVSVAAEFIPVFDLSKIGAAVKVTVIPEGIDAVETDTREDDMHTLAISVGIQKRIQAAANSAAEKSEAGTLVALVTDIVNFLSRRDVTVDGTSAKRREVRTVVLCDPEHLEKYRVFTSVLRITYSAAIAVDN